MFVPDGFFPSFTDRNSHTPRQNTLVFEGVRVGCHFRNLLIHHWRLLERAAILTFHVMTLLELIRWVIDSLSFLIFLT
jgi:hypothetical protein